MAAYNFNSEAKAFFSRGQKVDLKNANLESLNSDFLYHIGFSSKDNLPEKFGDVKIVIMGGSGKRMDKFAHKIAQEVGYKLPMGANLVDLSGHHDRYSMFKTGPILYVNHGMGMPSISILLHEITKLLHYAGVTDVCYIRMGTSGGIGCEPGSIALTDAPVNAFFKPYYRSVILGKEIMMGAKFDKTLSDMIESCWNEATVKIVRGNTMSTDDFYEGQGRLDGAICEYTEAQKMEYLHQAHAAGIVNIEMESLLFGAFCNRMGIPAAMCAVTLLNRLNGDQVSDSEAVHADYADRPQRLLIRFIKACIAAGAIKF
eukprot:comp22411_c0_seq1/m.33522 comp22411_c0_seq1/g.33522  ORF comp22411_c0_seq1/g.33522 comp22411_c0_seq1/m.33522 type:complete len:315 (-) comp22411_c0_seq1:410-1354(-)